MTRSYRDQDMMAEKSLAEFMDTYFYSKLESKQGGLLTFKRMSEKESQLKGIDVYIETGGSKLLIDEKASLYYSNVMIPTFAFELDSIQKGHPDPIPGWFVNDTLETEYYMLIWPNVKCIRQGDQWIRKDIQNLSKDDFTIVEAMLIKKSDIRMELAKQGYDRGRLIERAKQFRALYGMAVQKQDEPLINNVRISFSGQLAEKPVNLVIRKELLRRLAKGIYLISSDGYAMIRG